MSSSRLYSPSGDPISGSHGSSQKMRNELEAVEDAIATLEKHYIRCRFADLNNGAQSQYVIAPLAGTITNVSVVNDAANGGGAATAITLEIGGVAVTMPALTIASAEVLGTVQTPVVPTADNTVAAFGAIEVLTDGAGTGAMPGEVIIEITLEAES